jgi:hypothetical protein
MPTKKSTKKVAVTRKFLNDLARSIYDSKSRRFLRLCDGTLQNGPDPTNKRRPMHCGLGELYFAMTGRQPEETGVDEHGVVNLAVELSPLEGMADKARAKAVKGIESMGLPEGLKNNLIESVENTDDEEISLVETEFREILDNIPSENDDGCGDEDEDGEPVCSVSTYRDRSKRVAEQLRAAAKLLPA